MGYETKLIIGRACQSSAEIERGKLTIEGGEAYHPHLKDDAGNFIKTGRTEVYFMVMATIDLCKCGSDSAISKIEWKNGDEHIFWSFYLGDDRVIDDKYEDKSRPVPIKDVIAALEKDCKDSDYHRFKWALALLKSMEDTGEMSVLFYGH